MVISRDIFLKQEIVGEAKIARVGMYYEVTCACKLSDACKYRIIAQTGSEQLDFGLCVPDGPLFKAKKMYPARFIHPDEIQFHAIKEKTLIPNQIDVNPDKPFPGIETLLSLRFVEKGKVCIAQLNTQSFGIIESYK